MIKQALCSRRIVAIVILMLLYTTFTSALADNETITVNIKPSVPIVVNYNGNKSIEVLSNKLLIISQPISICLEQYYNACIRIQGWKQLYVSSTSTNNSIILFASNTNITVYNVLVTIKELASGEALLISVNLEGSIISNASMITVYLLSNGEKKNLTNIAFLRVNDNLLYLSLNYEKGRLPFIEFNSNDVLIASLHINRGIAKLVILLKNKNKAYEHVKGQYTRIVGDTAKSSSSSISIIENTLTKRHNNNTNLNNFVQVFFNPLFTFTTILLILSIIIWIRINNMLNK